MWRVNIGAVENFGDWIDTPRGQVHNLYSKLATEAEVAYNTVADYLSGKKDPYASTRVKLAKALGISANLLPEW